MASVNLNALTEVQNPASTDNLLLFNETSNVATRIDYDKLAEAILNKTRNEIGGVSPISAIAALNSRTDDTYNVRVRTSTNGSFAGLCNADGTYAVYVNDANGKYCYGQFTIMVGKSYNWVTVSNDTVSQNASNNQGTIVFTGGTAPYTAKVVRQTYTPSNATLETLNSRMKTFAVVEHGDLPEGDSKTIDLSAYQRKLFLLIVTSGAYVINVWGGSMIIQAIKETGYGTISIDSFSKILTIKASSDNTILYSLIQVH